jgi:glutamyl endopeptidase
MQNQALSSAATPELLNQGALGQGSWTPGWHDWRPYWVYTPVNYQVGTAVPLIMILHGCGQPLFSHPAAIAYDTHMNQLADTHQFLVVYPHHAAPLDPNPISCWNFFLPENQYRDSGEPASLADIVQDMLKNTSRWTIDRQRIYVAGISSGGGATANVGATYPDLFAAIGVHSGGEYGYRLPFTLQGEKAQAPGTVEDPSEAQALSGEVLALSGEVDESVLALIPPGPDPIQQGEKAFHAMGAFARVVPTMVFHGTDDHVSNPENGNQATQQWITTNRLASHGAFTATFDHPSIPTIKHPVGPNGERAYTVDTWRDDQGRDVVVYYRVEGMDHRWSGGSPGSIWTDPSGPDASQALYEFFMAHPKETVSIPTELQQLQPLDGHTPVSNRPKEIVIVTRAVSQPPSQGTGPAVPGNQGIEVVEGYKRAEFAMAQLWTPPESANLRDIGEASFGPPPPREETVHGPDDRVQITDTTVYPWRAHASLLITAADNSTWIATAWFIGPHTLMTAGHVVYIKNSGVAGRDGWVKSITVMPARNGKTLPYGAVTSTVFHSVVGWTEKGDPNYDYGAIILPTDLGNTIGWFGFGAYPDADLLSSTGNIAGYPGDKPAGTQWYDARQIASVDSQKVYYDIDTAGEQSGSAVWRFIAEDRYSFALHTYIGVVTNSGTRITTPFYNNMLAWKA